jgi:phosphopantetheinyl transferase (holo-ACP synthase)
MIVGVGFDLVDVGELQEEVEAKREEWLRRVFTATEREYASDKPIRTEVLREQLPRSKGALKALGTGWTDQSDLLNVEVGHWRPEISMSGPLLEVTVAVFAGLRRGEIEGLEWSDFHDDAIWVSRSIWNGRELPTKTRKSTAPVPVIRQLSERLELHRLRPGSPNAGPILRSSLGARVSTNNLLNRLMLPALNRCQHCLTLLFGFAWRVGNVLFGEAVALVGMALTLLEKLAPQVEMFARRPSRAPKSRARRGISKKGSENWLLRWDSNLQPSG